MSKGQRVALKFLYKSIGKTAQQIYRKFVNNSRLMIRNMLLYLINFSRYSSTKTNSKACRVL